MGRNGARRRERVAARSTRWVAGLWLAAWCSVIGCGDRTPASSSNESSPAEAAQTPDEAPAVPIESALPELIRQVEEAHFAEAVAMGNRLLGTQSLTSTQAVTIQQELGVAYVALERADLAEASFRAALALQPNLELDTVRTSPRVLEAFNRAKQPVDE